MTNIFKTVGWVIVIVLVVDFFCFMAWVASGQHPVDGFYFGAITANVLKFLIF